MSHYPKLSETCFRALQLLARIAKLNAVALASVDSYALNETRYLLKSCRIIDYDRENGGELLTPGGQPFVIDFHLTVDVPGEPAVIVAGNPSDGFQIIGPFTTWDDATEWAEANLNTETWIMELSAPESVIAGEAPGDPSPSPPIVEDQPGVYCRCGDCGDVHPLSAVKPWHECDGLAERLNVGHPLPAGECPACGAWSYPAPGVSA